MRNAYMTDELEAIYEQTVDFVAKEVTPHGDAWEDAGKVPREVLHQMGELGMFGLRVPEEHGGLGILDRRKRDLEGAEREARQVRVTLHAEVRRAPLAN